MQDWLVGIVGESLAPLVSIVLAAVFVVVLALVVISLMRRVMSGGIGIGSSPAPRLAVVDVTSVDQKRKLVLVRRDHVEHLILIGGQNDVVVEARIGQTPPPGQRAEPSLNGRPVAPRAPRAPEPPARPQRREPSLEERSGPPVRPAPPVAVAAAAPAIAPSVDIPSSAPENERPEPVRAAPASNPVPERRRDEAVPLAERQRQPETKAPAVEPLRTEPERAPAVEIPAPRPMEERIAPAPRPEPQPRPAPPSQPLPRATPVVLPPRIAEAERPRPSETAPAPAAERQPLSVRSFASAIQERPSSATPAVIPPTRVAPPVIVPPARVEPSMSEKQDDQIAGMLEAGLSEIESAPKSVTAFEPDPADAKKENELSLEEEMERLLRDFSQHTTGPR